MYQVQKLNCEITLSNYVLYTYYYLYILNLITNQHKCEGEVKYYYNSTK
jgi:hypothetical protein